MLTLVWKILRSETGGISLPEQDTILQVELAELLDGLTPPEQHNLKMIRENVFERGDSSHIISFRSARADACGLIPSRLTSTLEAFEDGRAKAIEQIRERVLQNPVFDEYVR